MKKTLMLLLSLAFLTACVAETVERRRPRKGPIKEVGFVDMGGGRIRYSTDGWSWFVTGRRRHALRKMRKNCGKKLVPQILDEYMHHDADISYSGEDISTNLDKGVEHFKIAPFQHFVYECRAQGDVTESPSVSTAPVRAILVVPQVPEIPEPSRTETGVMSSPALSTATAVQEPPQ